MLYALTQPERELLSNRHGTRTTQHMHDQTTSVQYVGTVMTSFGYEVMLTRGCWFQTLDVMLRKALNVRDTAYFIVIQWSITLCFIESHESQICRIPYENTSRTGVLNLPYYLYDVSPMTKEVRTSILTRRVF